MKVHVLQHVAFEGLGCIETWLKERRARVTFTRFYESTALPDVDDLDFIIVLGGPMSVNDELQFPWLIDEKRFIAEAIRCNKAILAICLGAQLIANALGAKVYPNREKEIGWLPLYSLHNRSGIRLPGSFEAFHWHGETFDLPPDSTLLASSVACKNQAFQIGPRIVGLQFHLEMLPSNVKALLAHCKHEIKPGHFIQSEAQIRRSQSICCRVINVLMQRLLDQLTVDLTGC
ncbi:MULTISPECIES: type 1 glutamine amidotransferase [Methylomonas]|uniref:Amidotransferase n=1 Tax=Methylomonas koyamae TaxID=702114 RepID=A0A177P0S8_9GAMM|nr:type 1 glutamine amidotransferase [Methylomonas koyamae]OAI23103.1 amidotransferase [Methylomonas koyamae]